MASATSKRLRDLAAEIPSDEIIRLTLRHLEPEHNDFSDHAIAMIGASLLEKALEVSILAHLRPLSGDERSRLFRYDCNGPIADFSARIKLADALGIFGPKTLADLNRIREIRNVFAHSVRYVGFATEAVENACGLLQMADWMTLMETAGRDLAKPRVRYIETCLYIASCLKSDILKPKKPGTLEHLGKIVTRDRLLP
jgi:hypothetical protein